MSQVSYIVREVDNVMIRVEYSTKCSYTKLLETHGISEGTVCAPVSCPDMV